VPDERSQIHDHGHHQRGDESAEDRFLNVIALHDALPTLSFQAGLCHDLGEEAVISITKPERSSANFGR
jgi:hypothetical protein